MEISVLRRARLLEFVGLAALALWLFQSSVWLSRFAPNWSLEVGFVERFVIWTLVWPIEWEIIAAVMALSLLASLVLLAKSQDLRLVDRFMGAFLLTNVLFWISAGILLDPFSLYSGLKLVAVAGRFVIFVLLALATVYGFFFSRSLVRWTALGATVIWLISSLWIPEPNSSVYFELRDELLEARKPQPPQDPSVTTTLRTYPALVHYVSYVGISAYALVRDRLRTRRRS